MSLVAAKGNAGRVCIRLLAQMTFKLSWVELSLTWGSEESVALGRGKERCETVVLEWKIVGASGSDVPESSRSSVPYVQG